MIATLRAGGYAEEIVGFASGEIPSFAANHALIKGYSIMGVRAGESARRYPERARAGTQRLLELATQRRLRPHSSHSFPLAPSFSIHWLLSSLHWRFDP